MDDAQLRYNSPDFCHEAMAEFVELLILPLTTALENLKASREKQRGGRFFRYFSSGLRCFRVRPARTRCSPGQYQPAS